MKELRGVADNRCIRGGENKGDARARSAYQLLFMHFKYSATFHEITPELLAKINFIKIFMIQFYP